MNVGVFKETNKKRTLPKLTLINPIQDLFQELCIRKYEEKRLERNRRIARMGYLLGRKGIIIRSIRLRTSSITIENQPFQELL